MEQEKNLDLQLWHACAGPLVKIPPVDSRVFYFAQGHIEHANAPPEFNAPRVPPLILCRVVAVKYLACAETEQVNAKITLLPLTGNDEEDNTIQGPTLVDYNNTCFAKLLTEAHIREGSKLSVLFKYAHSVFPPLDHRSDPPYHQTITAKDIHGQTWTFLDVIRGNPRRHLLTTGWSAFVNKKKLTAGDSVIFLRSKSGKLSVGIRRAKHDGPGLYKNNPYALVVGMARVEEAVGRAARGEAFEVVYYPRASTPEFCVGEADVRAAEAIKWCGGMRFKMAFESTGPFRMAVIKSFEGTVSNVKVIDPVRWPHSPWRMLEVFWDEQHLQSNLKHLSPWVVVELIPNIPAPLSLVSPRNKKKRLASSQKLHEVYKSIDLDGDDGSGVVEAFVQQSTQTPVFGVNLQGNPLHSVAQTSHLKAATPETQCMLVYSGDDADELGFIGSIAKKLLEREITPLTYTLLESPLIKDIRRFGVVIVVLSHSSVCTSQSLDYLVYMVDYWKAEKLAIIPIYFKVTLSDICGLEGGAFQQYLKTEHPYRVQEWKATIAEIASYDGHEWAKETQVMLAEEVVRDACLRLHLKNSKNMVKILELLKYSQPSEADIVGIWGMAGMGKTCIAREVFRTLAPHYDLCYFLQDFYLMCQTRGLRQMREDFYSKIFGEEKLSIASSDIKPSFMREWFHKKTILLVLDDVSNARDAEVVVGGFGWFSQGHRVILTSRRKQVLVQCKVKELFEIQKFCDYESFRLCKQYLNGESGIISELMSCSSGIPLALNVLGSTVSKQQVNNMKDHLQSLRRNPPSQIQEAFRRSFDGLDENEKNIFLDLACFFRGENKDYVVRLLDACGFRTYLGICDLIDDSLVSLMDNKIEIPIPFQDIGRFIVYEEDKDPSERSRLWDSKDIADVLTNNSGTDAIEGIFLDASDLNCELSPTVFGKMYRLRLLKFYCSTSGNQCKLSLPQGLETLPDELRLLHWENYPLRYLPQKFNPENLVELNMPYSNMEKLWEGKKGLVKLKKINLNHSTNLTDILLLSEALSLEHIDLEGCTSLVDVSTSIPRSGKLVSLNMKDCSRLRSLPAMVDLTSLKLNLSGCTSLGLKSMETSVNSPSPLIQMLGWSTYNTDIYNTDMGVDF